MILNRSNSNVGIQRAEVERALETKIRADLPSDRAVPLGVNRGKPVALADPGSDFSKAIHELAKSLIAAGPGQEEGVGSQGHLRPQSELAMGLHDRINGPVGGLGAEENGSEADAARSPRGRATAGRSRSTRTPS